MYDEYNERICILCPVCGESMGSYRNISTEYSWPVDTCRNCGYLFPVENCMFIFGKPIIHRINKKSMYDDVLYYSEPEIIFEEEESDSLRIDETCPD